MTMNRRTMLKGLGALSLLGVATPGRAAQLSEKRLLVVLLRGGMDGLAMVPPYNDPDHRRARGEVWVPDPGTAEEAAVKLNADLVCMEPCRA